MTERIVSRSFFCQNTARKLPEIEQYDPNTALKLLPNPPKNKNSKLGMAHCPNTALTLLQKHLYVKVNKIVNLFPTRY